MFLDMHLIHAIDTALQAYQGSMDAFQQSFPEIPAETSSGWFTPFAALKIEVREALSAGSAEGLPLVSVLGEGETATQRVMDKSMGTLGGAKQVGIMLKERARIIIYTSTGLDNRLLCRLVQVAILRAVPSFLSVAGYTGLGLEVASSPLDIEFEEEKRGLYMREIEVSAARELRVPRSLPGASLENIDWAVQLADVVEDPERDPAPGATPLPEGHVGSVIPEEE